MKRYLIFIMAFTMGITSLAKEYHVAKTGNDANPGTIEAPLHTIQAAANLAQPGDVITVHAGVRYSGAIPATHSDDMLPLIPAYPATF